MRVFREALPKIRQTRFIRYCEGLGRDIGGFESSLSELAPLRAGNSPIVDGNALSEATGLEPGPRMGRLKGMLHRIQVERDIDDKNQILALLRELDWMESEHQNWPALSWP